jgi:hypothetical protein
MHLFSSNVNCYVTHDCCRIVDINMYRGMLSSGCNLLENLPCGKASTFKDTVETTVAFYFLEILQSGKMQHVL